MLMFSRKLAVLAFISFLAGCNAVSEPSESEIITAIKQHLPAGIDVQEIRFKVFPDETGTKGRIDIAGTLVTTEDRVKSEDHRFERLYNMFQSLGATQEEFARYIEHSGLKKGIVTFYELKVASGTVFDFTSEFTFVETVDGFRFDGGVHYELCCIPISEINGRQGMNLIYDTSEFQEQYKNLLSWHNHEKQVLPALVEKLFGPLADGGKIVGENILAIVEPFNLKTAVWTIENRLGSNGRYFSAYTTKIPVTINTQTDFNLIFPIKGENNSLNIILSLDYANPQPNTACISMKGRNNMGYTKEICWDGNMWKWDGRQYGGMEDSRSKKPLSIEP